jgi:hypothetical protein
VPTVLRQDHGGGAINQTLHHGVIPTMHQNLTGRQTVITTVVQDMKVKIATLVQDMTEIEAEAKGITKA